MGLYFPNLILPPDDTTLVLCVTKDGIVRNPWGDRIKTEAIQVKNHGRLCDQDDILERIDGIWDCNDMVFEPNDHCCDVLDDCAGCKWYQTKMAIRKIVANVKTIIPADPGKEAAP